MENIIVFIIVGLAAIFTCLKLYKSFTGKGGCGGCSSGDSCSTQNNSSCCSGENTSQMESQELQPDKFDLSKH